MRLLAAAALVLALPAHAGWVRLTWDASPGVTAVRSGCVSPGQYERPSVPIAGAAAGNVTIEGLPDAGRCYFALNGGPQDEWLFDFGTVTGGRAAPGMVRNLAVKWSPTPPVTEWAHGWSFRNTVGFVTDVAGNTYSIGEAYPTTRTVGGHLLTFGWEGGAPETRNRSAAAGALAGVAQVQTFAVANTTRTFRVDLPAPGTYLVRLAVGDQQYPNRAYFELRDGTTALMSVPETVTPIGQFMDASRTLRTLAQWPAANVAIPLTFSTPTARLVLKRPSAASSVVSFLSFERVQ